MKTSCLDQRARILPLSFLGVCLLLGGLGMPLRVARAQGAPAPVTPAAVTPAKVEAPAPAPSAVPTPAVAPATSTLQVAAKPVPGAAEVPPPPGPGAPGAVAPGTVSPKVNDLDTTIPANFNNLPIDQLIKFLSDTTGKPVLKSKNVNAQLNLSLPGPVTKRRAMELIYDSLLMDNIYIVEQENQIQILPADAIKGLQLKTIGAEEDIQKLPDSFVLAQKIYKMDNIGADDLKNQLIKFIPETVISTDPKANTLVLTDRIGRLKYYDRVIATLVAATNTNRSIKIFKLQYADAVKLAATIGRVLVQMNGEGGGGGRGSMSMGGGMPPEMGGRFGGGGGGSGSGAVTSGNVTIVPEASLNWLIVSCPKEKMDDVSKLVDEFDKQQTADVQPRTIEITHIDVKTVAQAIDQLFPDNSSKAEKEQIRVVSTDDGNRLIIYSSQKNYDAVKKLVESLDSENAEKKETRSYPVKHLEVQDLADQLTKLWEEQNNNNDNGYFGYYDYYSRRNNQTTVKPSFVPSPRTNTLMVMARPRDFAFIEEMIEKLDVEVETGTFAPRIYQIKHTDANELVKVLETLFKEGKGGQQQNDDPWGYRWRQSSNKKGAFDQLFGEIRFTVDNVTNRIIALASNPKDYDVIDSMVKQLDQVDPEATEVMVFDLKFADALDVADRLNNLFSDGAVQQPNQPPRQNQQQNGNNNNNQNNAQDVAEAVRQIIYPWQSGGKERKPNEQERPINTMIGNIRIVPDIRSNKILCAAPPIYFDSLSKLVKTLDQQEPQVYIKARIVEVVHGKDRRTGIRWTPDPGSIDPAELENAITGLGQIGLIDTLGGGKNESVIDSQYKGLTGVQRTVGTKRTGGNTILGTDVNITLLLQLLVKNSNARVVSDPGISVHNNVKGNIFFGTEYPFQEGSLTTDVGSVTQNTTYKPVGISLDITPHINDAGNVVLKAELEDSNIRPGEFVNGQIIKDVRKFNTELAVESGQTVVIGGILLKDESNIDRHVPVLGAIPGLKNIFGKTDRSASERELVFFITPEVLKDRAQDDRILKETQQRLLEIYDQDKQRGLLEPKGKRRPAKSVLGFDDPAPAGTGADESTAPADEKDQSATEPSSGAAGEGADGAAGGPAGDPATGPASVAPEETTPDKIGEAGTPAPYKAAPMKPAPDQTAPEQPAPAKAAPDKIAPKTGGPVTGASPTPKTEKPATTPKTAQAKVARTRVVGQLSPKPDKRMVAAREAIKVEEAAEGQLHPVIVQAVEDEKK